MAQNTCTAFVTFDVFLESVNVASSIRGSLRFVVEQNGRVSLIKFSASLDQLCVSYESLSEIQLFLRLFH